MLYNMRAIKFSIGIIGGCLVCFLLIYPMASVAEEQADHVAGICYKFIDHSGNLISMMSRTPVIGDEIINGQGNQYRVVGITEMTAQVELIGRDETLFSYAKYYEQLENVAVSVDLDWQERPVGIYHTHSDESYLPEDGVASIPYKGGIFQVGEVLDKALKKNDIKVVYDITPHDPHDANAYYRSRRTAVQLLEKAPAAIIDVHRDGIDDPGFYHQVISDQEVAQIRLVVGRQNPKMSANLDFAKRLMAYVNEKTPGLIKEIYMAKGNYNQDLISTALLIEAGTYTNQKAQAESGVALLADAIPEMLGLAPPGVALEEKMKNSGAAENTLKERNAKTNVQSGKTALLIILFTVVAGSIFLLVNYPLDKIRNLFTHRKTK